MSRAPLIETQAIVLRRFDYSETSQVAHALTPAEGRVSLLAKGVKKPNPSLKGPIDLFQLARVRYRRYGGSDLAVLGRYEPLTGFRGVRRVLERAYAAFYLTELVYEATRELDPDPLPFQLLARALAALEGAAPRAVAAVVLASELAFFEQAGFRVATDSCATCGRRDGTLRFHPLAGGSICGACPRPPGRSFELRPGTRALLGALGRAGPRHAERIGVSAAQARELRALMRLVGEGVVERPLKSLPFVASREYGFLARRLRSRAGGPAVDSSTARS